MTTEVSYPMYFINETETSVMKIINEHSLIMITSGSIEGMSEQSYVTRTDATEEIISFFEEPDMQQTNEDGYATVRDKYVHFNKRLI